MTIFFSPEFRKELARIKAKQPLLFKKLEKQLTVFATDPTYPSLRIHKLAGKVDNLWSLSVTENHRAIYILRSNNEALFIDIGTHDQVYRNN